LKKSCEYFSITLDNRKLKQQLQKLARQLNSTTGEKFKVKVLLDTQGHIKLTSSILPKVKLPVKVKLSEKTIDPCNVFLYHKTTRRSLYDAERKKALKEGFFDTVFLNKNGELTEGTITNIFLLKKGILYTPCLKSGLLPGVLRQNLLKQGRAREAILRVEDIFQSEKVYIGNSVRGLLEARFKIK
jgi:para-aminobenzoate synthetase/4-amino-4-deoxychorismate lyase